MDTMSRQRSARSLSITTKYLAAFIAVFSVGVLIVPARHLPRTAKAQSVPPVGTYQAVSPHWSHIDLADFGRTVKYLDQSNGTYSSVLQWYAAHVDMVEVGMNTFVANYDYYHNEQNIKSINPSVKTFGYEYDATTCLHQGCTSTQPTMPTDRQYQDETAYLHFSEDTVVSYYDLQGQLLSAETIPGCPTGQPLSAACRAKVFIWDDYRWIINQSNTGWRTWYADHLLSEVTNDPYNSPYVVDGLFLDEHGPGFAITFGFGFQTKLTSGGGIREFSGVRPRNVSTEPPNTLDTEYATMDADWLTYLRGRFDAAGKFLHINAAEYFMDPLDFQTALAAKGAMTEHLNKPTSNAMSSPANYQTFLTDVRQITAAGGSIDLTGSMACDELTTKLPSGSPTFNGGNYTTPAERYKMWQLASYYLAKQSVTESGKVYLNLNLCLDQTTTVASLDAQWLKAYEVNVGQPTADPTVVKTGIAGCANNTYSVFRRDYGQATIFLRPRDGWWCQDYGDTTATTVSLGQTMAILQADGTLSAPLTSVSLRNNEAVILIPVDATAPAGVTDLHAG